MKIIKKIKMPIEEKNLLTKWLEELFNFKLPCEGLECSGIHCDSCPLDKICALKTDMIKVAEELLDTIEIDETDEKN